jgi:hypothetical protein
VKLKWMATKEQMALTQADLLDKTDDLRRQIESLE